MDRRNPIAASDKARSNQEMGWARCIDRKMSRRSCFVNRVARSRWCDMHSPPPAIQHLEQFVDLGLAIVFGAGVEGVRHAVLQVVAERLLLDLDQGGTSRADLRQHVDAVALLLDHAGDAPHLALDAAKPGELGFLQSFVHDLNYTPVGYRWQAMKHDHQHGASCGHDHHAAETATDPVCGMKVKIAGAKNTTVHEGHTYYFCNPKCLQKFTAEPDRYLKPAEAVPAPSVAPGTIFTCPMHPEIRQVGPGSCPICGMALEPAEVTLDQGPNEELIDMSRRYWIGLELAVPVFVLEMAGHLPGLMGLVSSHTSHWIQ